MNKLKLSLFCLIILNISLVSCLAVTLYTLTKQATWIRHTYAYVVTTYYTTRTGSHVWDKTVPKVESWNISGFTFPSQASTITIRLKNYDSVARFFDFQIVILETSFVIISKTYQKLNIGEVWNTPLYPFNSPSAYGNYTVQIAVQYRNQA